MTIRKFKILSGGRGDKPGNETERLDRFLDLSDPNLIQSLRQDDERRRRWLLALAALVLGLLVGGGGTWWLGLRRPVPAARNQGSAVSRDERAGMLVSQSNQLLMGKQFEKAWAYLELATEMEPGLVDAWDALARAQFYGGQTLEAERSARRCLEIAPGYSRAYHMLGDFSFYAGDWPKAKEYWAQAGKRERAFARLALLEGRFADAVPMVRQLVRDLPDDPYVRVMDKVIRAGRLTPELRLQLEPTYVASWSPETSQGWRLYHGHRYEEAFTAFSRALQQSSQDGSALLGRGWCLLRTGTAREAQSAFEQVLLRWPSNYSALNGMAWSLKAQGQAGGAVKLWQRVLELPHRPHIEISESLKGLGLVSYERGDYVRASSYLGQSFTMNPYDPETEKLLNDSLQRLPSPP